MGQGRTSYHIRSRGLESHLLVIGCGRFNHRMLGNELSVLKSSILKGASIKVYTPLYCSSVPASLSGYD